MCVMRNNNKVITFIGINEDENGMHMHLDYVKSYKRYLREINKSQWGWIKGDEMELIINFLPVTADGLVI